MPARICACAAADGSPAASARPSSRAGTSAAAHAQMRAGIDVVLHCARHGGRRRVLEIGVLGEAPDGRSRVVPAVRFEDDGGTREDEGAAALARLIGGS